MSSISPGFFIPPTGGFAITTTSKPEKSSLFLRNPSRTARFTRFRTTALPTFRPTTMRIRGISSSLRKRINRK